MAVALNGNALTTVAKVKYLWGRKQADESHDDRIGTLINFLSGRISDWCGRTFESTLYTDQLYDGHTLTELFLKNYPIIAVPAPVIKIDDVTVTTTLYKVYYQEGFVYYSHGWDQGHQNIKVTYQAGYATIPEGLGMACAEWAVLLLEQVYKDAKLTFTQINAEAKLVPDQIAGAIIPYKRMDLP